MLTLTKDDTGLDTVSPDTHKAIDGAEFRRIVAARKSVAAAQDELQAAVDAARAAGNSWTVIGAALDITRQAAQQRFSR